MSFETIIRAWKDEEFRNSLSIEDRSKLPANPAGSVELSLGELAKANGGRPKTNMECYSYRTAIQGCVCP